MHCGYFVVCSVTFLMEGVMCAWSVSLCVLGVASSVQRVRAWECCVVREWFCFMFNV